MFTKSDKSALFSFSSVAILIVFAALAGCAIPGRPDPALSERLEQNGYSFMPPDESGWFIAERSSNRVTVARLGKVEGQTYLIEGAPLALDGLQDAVHHWQMKGGENYPRHDPADITAIADNLLLLQRDGGGVIRYLSAFQPGLENGPLRRSELRRRNLPAQPQPLARARSPDWD